VIYLLHGGDSFQIHRAVEDIKKRLNTKDEESLASNTEVLDGAALTPLELMHHATALPFLAPSRLVIVEGLLAAIGASRGARSRKKGTDDALAAWSQVATELGADGALPETTTVIFVEGELGRDNAAFPLFAPIAQTMEYQPVKDREVASWVKRELEGRELKLTDRAIAVLVEAVGPDLWALYNELEKLEIYAQGEPVDEKTVAAVVAQARETKLWDMTDAVLAGNERKAVEALGRLLEEGEPAPLLASMLARQYRQIAIVKDLRDKRATEGEISRAAGVPAWKVKQFASAASRYSWEDLRRAYTLLVEADLSVKRGLQDDESSLQLLLHELCGLAGPTGGPRRPAVAR
jgi:DNA polymerase-3 subunit delta